MVKFKDQFVILNWLQQNTEKKNPDVEAKFNIVEFQSLGTKVKNTKRFYVINPTSLAYDFEWKKL